MFFEIDYEIILAKHRKKIKQKGDLALSSLTIIILESVVLMAELL
jgi:hypothetical protein